MAGTVVHLLVAERLLDRLRQCFAEGDFAHGETIPALYSDVLPGAGAGAAKESAEESAAAPRKHDSFLPFDEDLFVVGNVSPDCIMSREGYCRQMKLHTHFRDGIPDGTFDREENIVLFEKRMAAFWREHAAEEKKYPGLYLGYITHMMTDKEFILNERPKFFARIATVGLTEHDRETFTVFGRETDLVDFALLKNFPELKQAERSLKNAPPVEIADMMTSKELSDSREWILRYFYGTKHPKEKIAYLDYQSMVDFVNRVTETIIRRLFSEKYLIPCSE